MAERIDKTNAGIIALLKGNARMAWRDIGERLGISGQAVSSRVQTLEHLGIISGYTISQDRLNRSFVTVFMNDSRFTTFEKFAAAEPDVEAAYKVSGEGCYLLVVASDRQEALPAFLDRLSQFARYRVLSAMRKVK